MRIPLRQIICLIFWTNLVFTRLCHAGLPGRYRAESIPRLCPGRVFDRPLVDMAPTPTEHEQKTVVAVLTSLLSFALAVLTCAASMAVALAFVPCS